MLHYESVSKASVFLQWLNSELETIQYFFYTNIIMEVYKQLRVLYS